MIRAFLARRVWPWSEIEALKVDLRNERNDNDEWCCLVVKLRAEIERLKAGPKRDERGRFVRG